MELIMSCFRFLGRAALASVFIIAGIYMLLYSYDITMLTVEAHIPSCMYLYIVVPGVIIAGMVAALLFAMNIYPKSMATFLAILICATTYMLDTFWDHSTPRIYDKATLEFFKNLAIFGGLLLFICTPSSKSSSKKPD